MSQPGMGDRGVEPGGGAKGPGWPTVPPAPRALGAGDPAEVGPYRLEAVLGAGGMGRVYLGRTPAGSEVAVKLVHREFAGDRSFRKRFEQEVAAARRVQGLYTVPVVDADLRADEPWLATAYVPGPSLQDAVDEDGPLAAEAVLALTAKVAEALQSVHAAGVIHRDLKPSNIILTAEGPKVIDFGIARAADVTSVTGTGMRAGTPAYMAPEYIRGHELTEAVDVFALGLVAHYAATGRLAFGGGSGHGVTYRILEQEPDLDGCPGPVRTVVARCLAKEPQRRPGPAEIIRLCRQGPAPEAGPADGSGSTAVDAAGPSGGPGLHAAPTRTAATAPASPPASAPGSAPAPTKADPGDGGRPPEPNPYALGLASVQGQPGSRAGLIALGGLLLAVALTAVFLLPGTDDGGAPPWLTPTATLSDRQETVNDMAFSPDGKTLAAGVQEGTVRLWDVAERRQLAPLTQRDEDGREQVIAISALAFSPDGRTLAAAAGDGTLGVWDVAARRQTATLVASSSHPVRDVAFSPDGRLIATGSEDGTVRVWRTGGTKPRELAALDHGLPVWKLDFSPDSRMVASAGYEPSGSTEHTAKLWNVVGTPSAHRTLQHPEDVAGVAFSRDGKTVFTVGSENRIRRWDPATGRESDPLATGGFTTCDDAVAGPDGKTLATAHWREVRLWDLPDGEARAVLPGHENDITGLSFSPDGRRVATAADDGRVRLWKTTPP